MESKKRREHNTKRVGEAFRGNSWPLEKPSVNVIPRTATNVEPKSHAQFKSSWKRDTLPLGSKTPFKHPKGPDDDGHPKGMGGTREIGRAHV